MCVVMTEPSASRWLTVMSLNFRGHAVNDRRLVLGGRRGRARGT
jgi:hypothetical protein